MVCRHCLGSDPLCPYCHPGGWFKRPMVEEDKPTHKEIAVSQNFTHHRFHLVRDTDVSGISGTGVVAEGIEFTDKTVVVRWVQNDSTPAGVSPTTVVHETIESVLALHGHGGSTWVQWMDSESR